MLFAPEVLDDRPYARRLRMPKNKAGADLLARGKEVQLTPDFSVIPLFGFFKQLKFPFTWKG